MQIICMRAVYRGRPNNTLIRGKHPTPLQSHIMKQTNTTNPQNTPHLSHQCSGFTYYVTCRKTLGNCGCVHACVCLCVCVSSCVCLCVCVCVCLCHRV